MKVIKIGALWCASCLVMKPRWKNIEKKYPELKTVYYDFDNQKRDFEKYNVEISKVPTFIFLDNQDREITRITGEMEEKDIIKIIENHATV